jgi:TolB-like protein
MIINCKEDGRSGHGITEDTTPAFALKKCRKLRVVGRGTTHSG